MRIKAIVSYKGTDFLGWQKQDKGITVQDTIEKTLSKILDTEIHIYASGRTDAGVHAHGQVFHFDYDKDFPIDKLKYSVNSLLPKTICINSMEEVNDEFHARFSAKGKHYKYIINFKKKNPFTYEFSYNCLLPTDTKLLINSLKQFIGRHDFKDFTSKEEDEFQFEREIYKIDTSLVNDHLEIDIYGDGFMRYMIRYIIGASLAVAWKKEDEDYISYHLSKKDNREVISYKAPPQGLYLEEVLY